MSNIVLSILEFAVFFQLGRPRWSTLIYVDQKYFGWGRIIILIRPYQD
jgi:hypothetical protein